MPVVEPAELFALVERDVQAEVGLRAKLRSWSTPRRVALLSGVGLLPLAWHLLMEPRADLGGQYSPALLWGLLAVLVGAFLLGARWLLRGVNNAGPATRERWIALSLLLLPALVMLVAPLGATADALQAWGSPSICFVYGGALALPLVLAYALFERREHAPLSALCSVGALAGIAACALLHAHCASAHLGHLLLGHASIGVAWAVAVALLTKPLTRAR